MEHKHPHATPAPTNRPDRPRRDASQTEQRTLSRLRTAVAVIRHRQEALYDRFADRFARAFDAMQDNGREAIESAAESARAQLTAAGAVTAIQGARLKGFLLRDLDRTAAELRAAGTGAARALDPARLEAGALASIARALASSGDRLHEFAHRADLALEYRTGEVTSAGTLTCVDCGGTLRFVKTGTVPPCPRCPGTTYRKGY